MNIVYHEPSQDVFWILRHQGELLLDGENANFIRAPRAAFSLGVSLYVGEWQGLPCYATALDEAVFLAQSGEAVSLRKIFGALGMEAFQFAGRAFQFLDWYHNHRYCGRCATPMQAKEDEHAKCCPQCGFLVYPRISPAVMVLIRRGHTLLLARGPNFKPGMFSALAGFVEPGETLEACAKREVREEVGLEITNLRYFQSQPWPFPDSLMFAFFADYLAGEISPDPLEIEHAEWFPRDALPELPDPVSIARRLIDAACAEMDEEILPKK